MSARPLALLGVLIWLSAVATSGPHAAGPQSPSPRRAAPAAQPSPDIGAVVKQYCAGCHNERARSGGLTLTSLDPANVPADAEVWEKVIRKVRTGLMPPVGAPHPDAATRAALVTSLSTVLDRAAAARPNPGRPALYRMNRSEYANAIRDLLDLEVDAPTLLPPDDAAYGFDNIADVLSVSSTLMEQYVSAAGRVSALAVGSTDVAPGSVVFRIRQDASQDRHIEGLPFGTVGGLLARPVIQVEGDYTLSSKFFRTNLGVMRGLEYEHWLEYAVDGQRVHLFRVGGTEDWAANLENNTLIGDQIEERSRTRVKLTPGPHDVTVAWIDRGAASDPYRVRPPIRSSHDTRDPLGIPHLLTFTVEGPYNPGASGDTPSRRKVFICRPEATATAAAEEA